MSISKASSSAVAPGAKGDLVVGTTTNDSGILAVGANNTVLTADSSTATGLKWATVSSGGMTELATGSFSSTTTTISSISTSYKNLVVVIRDVKNATGADSLRMRFNNNSTSNYGSRSFTDASAEAAASSSSFNLQFHGNEIDSLIYIEIPDYANTSTFKMHRTLNMGNYPANVLMQHTWGLLKDTSAVTQLNFFWDSGYTFNAGTYILYGVS